MVKTTKKIIACNWKMNGSLSLIASYQEILDPDWRHQLIIFPPAVYLPAVAATLVHPAMAWGPQYIHHELSGAYTGMCSIQMFKDFQSSYVLIGHSECAHLENIDLICHKIALSRSMNLIPLLCIGEEKQGVLQPMMNKLKRIQEMGIQDYIVAYEPLWAIGKASASVDYIQSIYQELKMMVGRAVPVLYGGGLNPGNSQAILQVVDGGLFGNISLYVSEFSSILHCL